MMVPVSLLPVTGIALFIMDKIYLNDQHQSFARDILSELVHGVALSLFIAGTYLHFTRDLVWERGSVVLLSFVFSALFVALFKGIKSYYEEQFEKRRDAWVVKNAGR